MPTRTDIDRCIECWPKDWQDKPAFSNGQVATLLDEVERLQAELEDANQRIAALAAHAGHQLACDYLEIRTVLEAVAHGQVRSEPDVDQWVIVLDNTTLSHNMTVWHTARNLLTDEAKVQ